MKKSNSSLCGEHYDAIAVKSKTTERTSTPAIRLRLANNAVKTLQIEACVRRAALLVPKARRSIIVYDFACGRGGDLAKYGALATELGIFIQYYGVDVSKEAVAELYARWNTTWQRKFGKHMSVCAVVGDMCTRDSPAFYSHWPVADIVSIQFALHYAWHSITDARALANNIGRCLATYTGQLICNIVDSDYLLSLLSQHGKIGNELSLSFTNRLCEIHLPLQSLKIWLAHRALTKDGADESPMHNVAYNFTLKDCVAEFPEAVVLESDLKRLLAVLGLECCESLSFAQIEIPESAQLDLEERVVYSLYKTVTFARGLV